MDDGTPLTVAFRSSSRLIVGWFGPEYQTSYYYPREEHAALFAASARTLTCQHPAENLPGAVGVLLSRLCPTGVLHFRTLQGCFRIDGVPELSGKIAQQYGGWRSDLLRERLIMNRGEIRSIVFNLGQRRGVDNAAIMAAVADEFGYALEKTEATQLIFAPRA